MSIKHALFAASALLISNAASAADICKGGPKDQWLNKDQIAEKLTAMGHDTKFVLAVEDGCLEAKFVKDGKKIEIYMEPLTGEVVKTKGL